MRLTCRGIDLRYGGRMVLQNVDVELGPGVTCLLGPNGAGKTSLLRILAGVQRPTAGSVASDCGHPRHSDYRRRLGWVPQAMALPRDMRVREFLGYAAWLKGYDGSETDDRAEEAARQTGVASLLSRHCGAISGGEARRVVLAAALVNSPSLLLLDEPTAGLDPGQRESFLSVVTSLRDVTTVLSTHILEDAVLAAAHLAVLRDGRLGPIQARQVVVGRGEGDALAAVRRFFDSGAP